MNFIPGNISTGVGVEGIITQPGISTTQRALEKFNSDDQEKLKNEGITISFSGKDYFFFFFKKKKKKKKKLLYIYKLY